MLVLELCTNILINFQLCTAHGFLCELCPDKSEIFPWQNKIKRCQNCGSCYHEKCFEFDCTKCERMKSRRRQIKASGHVVYNT